MHQLQLLPLIDSTTASAETLSSITSDTEIAAAPSTAVETGLAPTSETTKGNSIVTTSNVITTPTTNLPVLTSSTTDTGIQEISTAQNTIPENASNTLPQVGSTKVAGTSKYSTRAPPTATAGPSTKTTSNWLPSTLIIDSTSSGQSVTQSTTSVATSALPKAISPVQTTSAAANYELITIGFQKALNYAFVVQNSLTSAQIFEYLPGVLTYAFPNVDADAVFVKQLVPYTADDVSYIITVAEVYYDSSKIDNLQNVITNLSSTLYSNPSDAERSLATLIDPRVPISGLLDSISDSGSSYSSTSSTDNSGNSSSDSETSDSKVLGVSEDLGSMDGVVQTRNRNEVTPKTQSSKVIGVIVGCVVGVVAYIGLIILFHRLRKRQLKLAETPQNSIRDYTDNQYPYDSDVRSFESEFTSSTNGEKENEETNNKVSKFASLKKIITGQSESQQPKRFVPQISAPINCKNSLGW
ncbi:unnamed protein product [[Candida] boidinii]|uniref:Unnamed protein product n=1 Tax=Candida boidinii TaxID=5477 RepID=A0A9W6SU21_CANBO|nr:unnamed protein product [[Candida] boidinii]